MFSQNAFGWKLQAVQNLTFGNVSIKACSDKCSDIKLCFSWSTKLCLPCITDPSRVIWNWVNRWLSAPPGIRLHFILSLLLLFPLHFLKRPQWPARPAVTRYGGKKGRRRLKEQVILHGRANKNICRSSLTCVSNIKRGKESEGGTRGGIIREHEYVPAQGIGMLR